MTRQAVAAAISALFAAGLAHAGAGGAVADLSITKSDAASTYTPGDPVTYTIVVGNAGPDAAVGATVSDLVTALAQVATASWTCVAAGGATCAAGPVAGNLTTTVDLPPGGTATFTLDAAIRDTATGDLVNTATVAAPTGTTDPVPANNSATDTDTAATIFFVAPAGTDSPTCGSGAIACKTIQAAIDNADPGDTIVVNNGTYNECPALSAPLRVESAEFRSAGTNALTIIDGTDACDPDDLTFGPVVTLVDGSTLRGFTIRDGGDSGVRALGAVAITHNLITANESTANGGGVRVLMGGNVADPEARTVIASNTIDGNKSAGSGAGIFVDATGAGIPSVVEIASNVITENTAGDGTAGVMGGGIAIFSDTASVSDSARIAITRNTVTDNAVQNAVGDATLGFGGGIFVVTGHISGLGEETVVVGGAGNGNVVRRNLSEGFGGGISAVARPAPSGKHTVDLESNTVTANTAGFGGGGLHVALHAADRTAGPTPDAILRVTSNTITGNNAQPDVDPSTPTAGGGIYAELDSDRTAEAAVLFTVSGNAIELNVASRGGGISLVASADDDPASDGATAPADANVSLHHNLVARNEADDPSSAGASGGGVHALAVARGGQASARVTLDFLTVAGNQNEVGAGGIELEESRPANSLGTTGVTAFVLSNSIVANNEGFGVGGTVLPSASTTIDVSFTDAFGNFSGNYEANLGVVPGTNGNLTVDPELDALFLPLLCGPTVDVGDPAIPATLEPLPNGGRVNLGHLGNSANATRTFPDVNGDGTIDGLDVLGIAVAFSAVSPDPRYFLAADRDLDADVDGEDLAYVSAFYAQSCP